MLSRADWMMGIIAGGRMRARLDVDRSRKGQRPGREAVGALGLLQ